jgi:hypothetical protein
MLFLRRLPPHVRVQLTEDDHEDLEALALHADRCSAFLARQSNAPVMSVSSVDSAEEQPELTISAIGRGGRGGKQQYRGNRGRNNKQRGQQQQQQDGLRPPPVDSDAPGDAARLSTGLCFFHFTYGSRARSCRAPCSWQGN